MEYVYICGYDGGLCLCGMHRYMYFTVWQPLSSSAQEMSNSEVTVSSSSRQVVPGSQQLHFNQETTVLQHIFCHCPAGSRMRLC